MDKKLGSLCTFHTRKSARIQKRTYTIFLLHVIIQNGYIDYGVSIELQSIEISGVSGHLQIFVYNKLCELYQKNICEFDNKL